MRHTRLKAIGITGSTLLSLVLAAEITYQAGELQYQPPEERAERLFLQPLGDFPGSTATELQEYFEHHFEPTRGLRITVLPTRPLPPHLVDPARGALAVDPLLAYMRGENPDIAHDPRAVMIGLTTDDIYSQRMGYVWAWRDSRVAVVSTAMFGPTVVGDSPVADLARTRLRKMVAKNVAILYYHKPTSPDPKSVLYHWLSDVPAIDRAEERF